MYFDNLKIRNRVEITKGDYTAYSYDDWFLGEWVGNINLYKDGKQILHATLIKSYTEKELEKWLDNYISKRSEK